jgi:V/A-type H+-transporting ATPase subunit I
MLSDAGYGILLTLLALFVIKKAKPKGSMKGILNMTLMCGIGTIIIGALFSSWFGDFPQTLSYMITGSRVWELKPILFAPLDDTMTFLGIALAIGTIHLFIGVGLSAWRQIQEGDIVGAFFDSVPWYLLIIGAVMTMALDGAAGKIGLDIAVGSQVLVVFGSEREAKSIFSRIGAGLWNVYGGVAGFLSDIFSYSRLMALGLATGVVASVMNILASFIGNGVFGWIFFIIIFIGGQLFNMILGLLGAFVHSVRLEYVEFFSKFFVGGGRPFAPLSNQTKFVQVIKEEN